ncbi:PID-CTERM protein-sorting domain-containing protein [Aureibaculum conchae]|uniref:PID-CTERM protein-sorting domain-containing protein n=1 Tax=Aureibaculum sp. 2308TA14-22 TaxID=3108392 RepID=UPI0033952B1F
MFRKYITLISVALLIFISSSVFAQGSGPPAPGGAPGDCPACPPSDLPIDGGLGVLLAIGIGYAVKKLRKED